MLKKTLLVGVVILGAIELSGSPAQAGGPHIGIGIGIGVPAYNPYPYYYGYPYGYYPYGYGYPYGYPYYYPRRSMSSRNPCM